VKLQSNGSAISFQWRSKALSVRATSATVSKSFGSSSLRCAPALEPIDRFLAATRR